VTVTFSLPLWVAVLGPMFVVLVLIAALIWWGLRDPPDLRAKRRTERPSRQGGARSAGQSVPRALRADPDMSSAPARARAEEVRMAESNGAGDAGMVGGLPDPYAGLPDDHLLAPAPLVRVHGGAASVPEWLKRYHPRGDGLLMEAVQEMYRRAAGVPTIADYFGDADLSTLPRHFHATLSVVASRGLTVGLARRMAAAHARVTDSSGRRITVEVFDAVVGTLAGILAEYGLPEPTLRQIAAVVAPLRVVIAVESMPAGA
jgi:truncated hemoglobin YjbI